MVWFEHLLFEKMFGAILPKPSILTYIPMISSSRSIHPKQLQKFFQKHLVNIKDYGYKDLKYFPGNHW